jgi:hypothetical protein
MLRWINELLNKASHVTPLSGSTAPPTLAVANELIKFIVCGMYSLYVWTIRRLLKEDLKVNSIQKAPAFPHGF